MIDDRATGAERVVWDLSDLESRAGGSADELRPRVRDFRSRHVGTLSNKNGEALAAAITELEALIEPVARMLFHAQLRQAADATDAGRVAAPRQAQETAASLQADLAFFVTECQALGEARRTELLASPALARRRQLLTSLWQAREKGLTEREERIITEKSLTGAAAWGRLFSTLVTSLRIHVGGRQLALEEALALLEQADGELRGYAAAGISDALQRDIDTRAFAINAIALDRIGEERLRRELGASSGPEAAPPSSDRPAHRWDQDGDGVGAHPHGPDRLTQDCLAAVTSRHDICRRHHLLKAQLMNMERLRYDRDRLAPIRPDHELITWTEARRIVVDANTSFSPELGRVATEVFDRHWIDAAPREGKVPHAFTVSVPGVHPYVLLSYTGTLRSLLVLAHEIGDAVRGVLASEQPLFSAQPGLPVAEAASLLGEQLTFHHLIRASDDAGRRLELLMVLLDSAMNMVFRHAAMTTFELSLERERRARGELSSETMSDLWMEAHRTMLGDSVELPDSYRSWWSFVPHLMGAPGHEAQHAVAYLAAHAIHRRHSEGRGAGVEGTEAEAGSARAVIDMFRAGGSDTTENLLRISGLEVTDPSFWRREVDAIDGMVVEAENLASDVRG
ncbi:MAG: M3 family metallopeptidase [Candidatus Dormibacteria bacterium]